ncbi:Lacal_2735 family protein [Hyunsoonleella sp. 2307UL5-6]|uniref:Lacal_2735 family protein n=1 Tax=Hyunsoonleella sp. 2307UL5-6 TaxID=3384768 RepID=UPI0039BD3B1F
MFTIFIKKTKRARLEEKFKKLMKEWHRLSSTNKAASDQKFSEAQKIAKQLNMMNNEAA